MRKGLSTVAAIWVLGAALANAEQIDGNVVYRDNEVRFTVVSPCAVRMEYSKNGNFTEEPSYMCAGREFPKTEYDLEISGDTVVISTEDLQLKYLKGRGQFSDSNLCITANCAVWTPGVKAEYNLGGTELSLDGVIDSRYNYKANGHPAGSEVEFKAGLLNKDGWTLLDDSEGPLITAGGTISPRGQEGGQDWWFVAYGQDYKKGLQTFNMIMGAAPLLPRYAFGSWWSRYWMYTQGELEDLVDTFDEYNYPLDVLGVDMDWHFHKNNDESWYSWTANSDIFPDIKGCLERIKGKGPVTNTNIHPGKIVPADSIYTPMAQALGRTDGKELVTDLFDPRFAEAFSNIALKDLRDKGFDFWWWDNGTGRAPKEYGGITQNSWQAKCLYDEMLSTGRRPVFLCRYAGWGSHRYIGVGFSGDTYSSWGTLETVVRMSSSACNSLFGSWSHDIAGFQSYQGRGIDDELYVRWMQFSACSPFVRWQSAKQREINKYPWLLAPKYEKPVREALKFHYRLAPHIYTLAREMHETGVGFTRPLYYTSREDEAYNHPLEYTLGDDVLFCAVTTPAQGFNTAVNVWLPAGQWYEWASGEVLSGGSHLRRFALDEFPVYLRAGSVTPMYDGSQKNLKSNDEAIALVVAPGEGSYEYSLYEDAGDGLDYGKSYARTVIRNVRQGNRQTVTIEPRKGRYDGMPSKRRFYVELLNAGYPVSVRVNGREAACSYDGKSVAAVIDLGEVKCSKGAVIEIEYSGEIAGLNGLKGRAKRVRDAMLDLQYRDPNLAWFPTDDILRIWTVSDRLSSAPADIQALAEEFDTAYGNIEALLEKQYVKPDNIERFISILGLE